MKQIITYATCPIPLPFKQGWLSGSTLHDWRYPPEQETVAFFEKNITKDDIVADIGANIGYYTILFSKLAKKVVAFEPSPRAFKWLKWNTRFLPNVEVVNKGIYSKRCKLPLYNSGTGHGSVVYKQEGFTDEVELIPLSDYPETFTWAKIDVEGAEREILKNINVPNIVVEGASIPELKGQSFNGNIYIKGRITNQQTSVWK